jgi:truncated hemoglobin YjbI
LSLLKNNNSAAVEENQYFRRVPIMDMTTEDILKKALLDTQEKVRDFMHYTRELKDEELQSFFKEAAEEEAKQARQLQQFLGEIHR